MIERKCPLCKTVWYSADTQDWICDNCGSVIKKASEEAKEKTQLKTYHERSTQSMRSVYINGTAMVNASTYGVKINEQHIENLISEHLQIDESENYKEIPCKISISIEPIIMDLQIGGNYGE